MTLRRELEAAGHALRRGVLGGDQLGMLAKVLPAGHAARNLLWERAEIAAALEYLGIDRLACEALGDGAFPINVIYFDKTEGANWKVPGHQDLMMPIERQVDEPGFGGWSTKAGVVHVEPPVEVLERLVALRIHLDDCPASNGPLAVVPGSHTRGKLGDAELGQLAPGWFVACEAAAGDVLLMKPLVVHRSSPAESPRHRRVLHVVYAVDEPGETLRWKRPPDRNSSVSPS
jgi:hypothetical protein